jgi:hypothetical protein
MVTLNIGNQIEPGSVTCKWHVIVKNVNNASITDIMARQPLDPKRVTVNLTVNKTSRERIIRYTATDENGKIFDANGDIDYLNGIIELRVLPPVVDKNDSYWDQQNGQWTLNVDQVNRVFGGQVRVDYTPAGIVPDPKFIEVDIPPIQFRIMPPLLDEQIVQNSVRFTWNGQTYNDYNGVLFRSNDTIEAGTINYLSGIVTLNNYIPGAGAVNVTSMLTRFGQWTTIAANFRTALSPLVPEALQIVAMLDDGTQITADADEHGVISGDYIRGEINYIFGTAWLEFGQEDPEIIEGDPWVPAPVIPESIAYNAVAYKYLPLVASILGVDAVRLPPDGRVPIYRPGNILMIMHAAETAPATVANGGTISCGRTRVAWVRVIDADGVTHGDGYELDRALGVVTFTDVSEMTMPVTVRHTVGDLRMCTDAQINGELAIGRALTHYYPANESIVASCLIHGDRRARVSHVWDQASWNGTWTDFLVGNEATATLDTIAYPIEVTNEGAETERWILRWTSTTNVELIGQRRGLVFSGPFNADIAPTNPRTRVFDEQSGQWVGGVPYLLIPVAANGGGWSTGNVVRINTVGAIADIWMARAIMQSDPPIDDGVDGCELYALGNIDNPVQ